MNPIIMCTAVALNMFTAPGGHTDVGMVPAYQPVQILEGSFLRDWVFIGKPEANGNWSPRGWVKYAGLGYPTQNGYRHG
jgi:hypothetical protein